MSGRSHPSVSFLVTGSSATAWLVVMRLVCPSGQIDLAQWGSELSGGVRVECRAALAARNEENAMAFAGNVDELALLQSVRLKGQVGSSVLAEHLGVSAASGQAAYDALIAQGKALESEGTISLTEKGLTELNDQLDAERVSIDEDSILDVLEAFLPLDEEFSALVARADADSLADLDRRASNVFDDLSAFVPRLSRYQDLLSSALTKVQAGELKWMAETGIDSYATVWVEIRQELCEAAGKTQN